MKAQKIIPKTAALFSYHPVFRSVMSAKRKRRLTSIYHYGTSSKPASARNLPSKIQVYDNLKSTTDTLMPLFWKSLTVASSLLSNITSQFTRTKPTDGIANNSTSHGTISVNVQEFTKENTESLKEQLKVETSQKLKTVGEELESVLDHEQSFFELLSRSDVPAKNSIQNEKKAKKPLISKSSLQQRSRFLVFSLTDASSSGSRLLRLEEVCKHLLLYPEQKAVMCKAGLVRTALHLGHDPSDLAIQEQARLVLALVGYHKPPRGEGIRILTLDGGGTRNIMSIEILKQLELATNMKVHEMFDFICGVSSGAILTYLLGGLRLSTMECEALFMELSKEIFSESMLWGTSRLMWSHAYYDTSAYVNILKKRFGEKHIIDTAKEDNAPKLATVSSIMNLPRLEAFVFRNYDFPPHAHSYYKGSCRYRMWEAVRASGAAPGYFQEFCLDDYLHQDGGVMMNNPTALAIHEARLLWPSDPIQCVLSLGSGRYIPPVAPQLTSTSLKTKVLKIIDSATDTEAVHTVVNDLLSADTYFRINPYLTEFLTLDENRSEKLEQLKNDAHMYLRRNEYKFSNAVRALKQQRRYWKIAKDYLCLQKDRLL